MWKAIKEFFGHYDAPTLQKGSGGSTTIVTKVKAPTKAATKATTKKAPAKKAKPVKTKAKKKNGK